MLCDPGMETGMQEGGMAGSGKPATLCFRRNIDGMSRKMAFWNLTIILGTR